MIDNKNIVLPGTPQSMKYHPLTNIHPNAKIGKNTVVQAFATIEADVVIGENCWIGANAVIMDGTRMGDNCKIFPGAIVGAIPQDLKFNNEYSTLQIGNNVTIREYCTLNRGTDASGTTIIEDDCLLMAYVHIAHDCIVRRRCVLANNVTLAGHIEVGEYAVLGGMVAVHQFVRIGKHTMIGGGSLVRKDVPPYVKAAREPLSYAGLNSIGLRRRGFSKETIHHLQDIYRILFVKGYNTRRAIEIIETTVDATDEREEILAFLQEADRGLMRGFKANGK